MADDLHDDWWAKDDITDDKEGELNGKYIHYISSHIIISLPIIYID